jgi:hypothetical protein
MCKYNRTKYLTVDVKTNVLTKAELSDEKMALALLYKVFYNWEKPVRGPCINQSWLKLFL